MVIKKMQKKNLVNNKWFTEEVFRKTVTAHIACLLFSVILGPDGDAYIVSYIQGRMEPDVGIQDNWKIKCNIYIVQSKLKCHFDRTLTPTC